MWIHQFNDIAVTSLSPIEGILQRCYRSKLLQIILMPNGYFGQLDLVKLPKQDVLRNTSSNVEFDTRYFCPLLAIILLKDKSPGSFVVRDSNSYPGAFGLALKVAQIPANVQTKSTGDPSADLVRHFLIEPTHKGVRLRGSNNEPIFGKYSRTSLTGSKK